MGHDVASSVIRHGVARLLLSHISAPAGFARDGVARSGWSSIPDPVRDKQNRPMRDCKVEREAS
jgi:hypothetical protein